MYVFIIIIITKSERATGAFHEEVERKIIEYFDLHSSNKFCFYGGI